MAIARLVCVALVCYTIVHKHADRAIRGEKPGGLFDFLSGNSGDYRGRPGL